MNRTRPLSVVIVGGGIAGLAAAHDLVRAHGDGHPVDVTLVEKGSVLGGNLRSERGDGFVVDGGPDSWVVTKPDTTALVKEIGLEKELVTTIPENRRVYVAHEGELHPLPEGLVLGVPTRIRPVVETRLFTWRGKMRMAAEPFVPARSWGPTDDESIGDFVSRRLGRELAERLAAPLLGGIFGGDAWQLSLRATFPQFIEQETKYRSLVRAMRATRKPPTKGQSAPSAFQSLARGIGSLTETLEAGLVSKATILRGRSALAVSRNDGAGEGDAAKYVVSVEGQDPLRADAVVVAAPAHAASSLLRGVAKDASELLATLGYGSTATVFHAWKRADVPHALDATGFLVPRSSGRPILASTWVSSKWAGRAPEGKVLLRTFVGGAWGEEILRKEDSDLVSLSLAELRTLMKVDAAPLWSRVFRFEKASPQPLVGHVERMEKVRAALAREGGLFAIGTGYDGVGISDCIRQGRAAARTILAARPG
ncbi:MAG: protoporphyrinogen oxidase [Polyangiaceae bacterium]